MSRIVPEHIASSTRLLSVEHYIYEDNWKSIMHSHFFTELFYVVNGEGEMLIKDKIYPIKKNHLVLVNPHIMHTELSVMSQPLEYIVLGMGNIMFDFDYNEYKVMANPRFYNTIYPYLTKILKEFHSQEPMHKNYCHNLLQLLLIQLYRESISQIILSEPRDIPSECHEVKKHIDKHYKENITLDDLANLVHWNKFYLSHSFIKAYGIAPIRYLQEKRILISKELLAGHDLSISEVSSILGFSSHSYFSQAFKKSTGFSPQNYRKQMLASVR